MAVQINLDPVANQSFSVQLDGARYVVRLVATNGVMAADIERDGVAVVTGSRVLPGVPLIPYTHLEAGNFMLVTAGDDLPDWPRFGVDQFLVFLTEAEISG